MWNSKVGLRHKTFNFPYIPEKRIKNAKKIYSNLSENSLVIALHDSTIFGNAKNGILFTTEGISWKVLMGKKDSIKYNEIDISKISINIKSDIKKIIIEVDREIDTAFDDEQSLNAICEFLILSAKYSKFE